MKKQDCYVFGAGEYYGAVPSLEQDAFVIAVDGGLAYLKGQGIKADLLIGDFDSLGEPPEGEAVLRFPQEKDDTDMLAALKAGLERGFQTFHIYGGTGGRFDHTMANIQCLAYLASVGGRGYLYGRDTVTTALGAGSIAFPADAKGLLSIFAHTERVTGVYEEGLKYALANKTLENTYPLGVSNEFIGLPSNIKVKSGILMVMYPQGVKPIL